MERYGRDIHKGAYWPIPANRHTYTEHKMEEIRKTQRECDKEKRQMHTAREIHTEMEEEVGLGGWGRGEKNHES